MANMENAQGIEINGGGRIVSSTLTGSEISNASIATSEGAKVKLSEEQEKTFTQDEVNKVIENRLMREREKAQQQIKDAVSEAERMAKMNADEKAKHEQAKRIQELEAREQEITKRELRTQALEMLAEKGLPRDLAETLPYIDAETTMAALSSVEKAFRQAVEQAVTDRLRGDPPKKSQAQALNMSDAEIKSMTYQQRVELHETDPQKYKKLFGGE